MTTTFDATDGRLIIHNAEVRRMLGDIGATKFSELCNSGELERIHIGRKRYCTAESVYRYYEKLRAAAGQTEPAEEAE